MNWKNILYYYKLYTWGVIMVCTFLFLFQLVISLPNGLYAIANYNKYGELWIEAVLFGIALPGIFMLWRDVLYFLVKQRRGEIEW